MKIQSIALLLFTAPLLNSCGGGVDGESTKTNPEHVNKSDEKQSQVAAKADFGSLLIELESNIGWSAVSDQWRTRRDGWISDCKSKSDISDKASLLIEFESNLSWEAVDPRWVDRRETWINDLYTSSSNSDLSSYLAELEEYIIWEVVSPNWVNLRDVWVKNCHELGEGAW